MIDLFENDDNEAHEDSFGAVTNGKSIFEYKPWHKPRKQWVRDKQWWGYLQKLLIKPANNYADEVTIKYFGLPGAELLDVDYLSKKMLESTVLNDKKLLIHGVVKSPKEKQVADSRLTKLIDRINIDENSKVERGEFEAIANRNSMLWNKMKSIAPYHFINLDFCDRVLEDATIGAVYNLLEYQFAKTVDKRWLFCLTTKIDTSETNSALLGRLDECLHKIEGDELAIYNLEEYFEPVFELISKKRKISDYIDNAVKFTDIFLVGFVIWLVLTAIQCNVNFKLKSSSKYTIASDGEVPDMYSFVFEFNPFFAPQVDHTGIATTHCSEPGQQVDIAAQKQNLMRKLSSTLDIDDMLGNNNDILEKYIDDTKQLLAGCGWDVSNYEQEMCPEFIRVSNK